MSEQNEIQGVQYEGILAKGYGLIPKLITRDKDLSIEAKAIYAYLAAFAGNTQQAFPGVSLICDELNISENRYLKHRKQLLDKGYVEIKRERLENGFSKNIYILKQNIPVSIQNVGIQNVGVGNVGIQNVGIQNEGTNSNSSIINNSINNSTQKQQLQKESSLLSAEIFNLIEKHHIAALSEFTATEIDNMINDTSEEIVLAAVKETIKNNGRSLRYIESIVRNWKAKGYKTVEQIKNAEGGQSNGTSKQNNEPARVYDDGVNF